MKYGRVKQGVFLERPNRFVARVEIQGTVETVHVKNTGRCGELLLPGAAVYLEDHGDAMGSRKTRYDLIAVEKRIPAEPGKKEKTLLINMDSQAPNKVVAEALRSGGILLPGFPGEIGLLKPESVFGGSRFDFYLESQVAEGQVPSGKAYIEVKGVTLEEDGVARFPDAPTERGVKHIGELCRVKEQGMEAYLIFVVQMKSVTRVEPNDRTHRAFGDALRRAAEAGVHVLAWDCIVEPDSLTVDQRIPVQLFAHGPDEGKR